MAYGRAKILNKTYKNVDPIELDLLMEDKKDCYLDETKSVVKRQGLAQFLSQAGVPSWDGAYFWEEQNVAIFVANTRIYRIDQWANITDLTANSGIYLVAGARPTFALNALGTNLVIANGGKIVYTNNSTVSEIGDADAPTTVSHVAFLDQYILANDTTSGRFYWSDTADETSWGALSFETAEGLPDILQSIITFQRELLLFGTRSFEIWYNDGVNPFSRKTPGFTQIGCIAKHSAIIAGDTVYWLDNKRRFVRKYGINAVSVSKAFDKELQSLNTVSDCQADYIFEGGRNHIYLTFPTENKTFAFDIDTEDWFQVGHFDSAANLWNRWIGNCHVYCKTWNAHLVGGTNNKIYSLSSDNASDAGDTIGYEFTTGHIDWGIWKRKRSHEISLKMKCGDDASSTSRRVMFQYRDDGGVNWSDEEQINLSASGNTEFVVQLFGRGIYRTRQYKFRLTDSVKFSFIGMEEKVEVLK